MSDPCQIPGFTDLVGPSARVLGQRPMELASVDGITFHPRWCFGEGGYDDMQCEPPSVADERPTRIWTTAMVM